MTNLSYCRFRNTLKDLRDCLEHWDDELEDDELTARNKMQDIFNDWGEFEDDN